MIYKCKENNKCKENWIQLNNLVYAVPNGINAYSQILPDHHQNSDYNMLKLV